MEQLPLVVGRIKGSFGVKGWLKVEPLTDYPSRFRVLKEVFWVRKLREPLSLRFLIEKLKIGTDQILLKFEECSDRETAKKLKGGLLVIPKDQAVALPKGRYYQFELLGLEVFLQSGEFKGEVIDIWPLEVPHPILVVLTRKGEKLVPLVKEIVEEINLNEKKLFIKNLEGLFD